MDRRGQSYLIMTILIVLMVVLAVVFALVASEGEPAVSGGREKEQGSSFPWIIFIPVATGAMIPLVARKQSAVKLQGSRKSRIRVAAILIVVTSVFLASVSYIVLRAY